MRTRDSQPRLLRFDRANLFWINESRVRRQLQSADGKGRLRLCSAEKNGKTDAVVQPDSTSFAACEHLRRRPHHASTAPSRATHPCSFAFIRGFKMRFIDVQTNSTSIREASSLHVLTTAITRLARVTLQSEIRHRRQLGVHCVVSRISLAKTSP